MKNAWNTYWKDYGEWWKVSNEFYKKHWKGLILMEVGLFAATYVPLYLIEKKHEEERDEEYYEALKGLGL